MKKIMVFMFILLNVFLSGCDLSHKHYYNDRGVCNCGDDIAHELTYSQNQYNGETQTVNAGEVYYYKFTSHGEEGIDLYLDCETVKFDRVEVRADGILQTVAGPKEYSEIVFSYDANLIDKRVYFLKVTYKGSGDIRLAIRESI